jgi:hypothetical protein
MFRMATDFNTNPILNSSYQSPWQRWQLDSKGQPVGEITDGQRKVVVN